MTTQLEPREADDATLDEDALAARLLGHLDEARSWAPRRPGGAVSTASGLLAGVPVRAIRSEVVLSAPLARVVHLLCDASLDYLPRWNVEYLRGEVLETREVSDARASYTMRVEYATPAPLANREYVYRFFRRRVADDAVLIGYRSVRSALPTARGAVRALLYPTAHLCRALSPAETRVEHVLATDLRGVFPTWLQRLLVPELARAAVRDALAQRALLADAQALEAGAAPSSPLAPDTAPSAVAPSVPSWRLT